MTPLERDHERGLNGALAAEIRAELAVQNRKQTWLALKTDMDRVTLRRYLMAERAMNTALIEAISTALGLDEGELMTRAVQRRNRYPELYSPHASDIDDADSSDVRSTVEAIDRARRDTRPARTRNEMQQMDREAARRGEDRNTGA